MNTEEVIVITTKNHIQAKSIQLKDGLLLEGLQEIVGGWVEIVHPLSLDEPYCMIVNEDGLLRGLEVNPIASLLYGTLEHGYPIVGDVAIMKDGYRCGEPDIVGLNKNEIRGICTRLEQLLALWKGDHHDQKPQ